MMAAKPTIGSTPVKHVEHFKNGVATVTITIPLGAKGKLLTIPLTVKVSGVTTTRIASYRIA
jgi:hypothetical protein